MLFVAQMKRRRKKGGRESEINRQKSIKRRKGGREGKKEKMCVCVHDLNWGTRSDNMPHQPINKINRSRW